LTAHSPEALDLRAAAEKVFIKPGVESRNQLGRVLAD
jgi:hypothetical protein